VPGSVRGVPAQNDTNASLDDDGGSFHRGRRQIPGPAYKRASIPDHDSCQPSGRPSGRDLPEWAFKCGCVQPAWR